MGPCPQVGGSQKACRNSPRMVPLVRQPVTGQAVLAFSLSFSVPVVSAPQPVSPHHTPLAWAGLRADAQETTSVWRPLMQPIPPHLSL